MAENREDETPAEPLMRLEYFFTDGRVIVNGHHAERGSCWVSGEMSGRKNDLTRRER